MSIFLLRYSCDCDCIFVSLNQRTTRLETLLLIFLRHILNIASKSNCNCCALRVLANVWHNQDEWTLTARTEPGLAYMII